jgi:hypothetical protein
MSVHLDNTAVNVPLSFYSGRNSIGGVSGSSDGLNKYITANKWNRVAVQIDTGTRELKVYTNGTTAFTTADFLNAGASVRSLRITLSNAAALSIDDIKVYSGAYNNADYATLTPVTANESGIIVSGSRIGIPGAEPMSVADFEAGLDMSAAAKVKIFDSGNVFTTTLADSGIVGSGQVLTLYSAGGEIIKYYTIVKAIDVQDFIWTVPEAGKVAVSTTVSSIDPNYSSATLIIAKYVGGRLDDIDTDTKPLSAAPVTLSTSLEGDATNEIKAFLWKDLAGMTMIPITSSYSYPGPIEP